MYEHDYSKIILTFDERLFLFKLRFKKKSILPSEYWNLYVLDLVQQNKTDKLDGFNDPIPDGTYSLTVEYKRYCIYKRNEFFKGKLPVIISVIALLKSYQNEILSLLQVLKKLLK